MRSRPSLFLEISQDCQPELQNRGGSNLSSARLGLGSNKVKSSVKARLEVGSKNFGSKKARIKKSSKNLGSSSARARRKWARKLDEPRSSLGQAKLS